MTRRKRCSPAKKKNKKGGRGKKAFGLRGLIWRGGGENSTMFAKGRGTLFRAGEDREKKQNGN